MVEQKVFEPEWAVPPGQILADALTDRGWSQAELARRTDRPVKTINEIVKGKATITPDTAIQFERVMGIPARLWLNLERLYAEARAREESRAQLETQVDWIDRFPVSDLVRHELLPRTRDKTLLLDALLHFLGTSSPDAWERQWQSMNVALRRSRAFAPQPEALSTWLRWGEIEAQKLTVEAFSVDRLRGALPAIRAMTLLDPVAFQEPLQEELARAGIILLLIPEIAGARISGAARWLDSERAAVQLSLRHKNDDQFWFALFHEIGHLLEGIRRRTYVDLAAAPSDDPEEGPADQFARDVLVDRAAYEEFVSRGIYDAKTIRAFAKGQHVAAGVVVGRLQHDRHLSPSGLQYLKRTFDWAS